MQCPDHGQQTNPSLQALTRLYTGWNDAGTHKCKAAAADSLPRRVKMKLQQPANRNVRDLLSDLKSCSKKRDLQEGRQLHKNALETGKLSNMFVAVALINMYSKCGSMVDARRVFDRIKMPDVVSWNVLILGYAANGEGQVALDLFSEMKTVHGCAPNSVTYLAAIKAFSSLVVNGDGNRKRECLESGRKIHLEIGCHLSRYVQNTLIDMYCKCGSMSDARKVFDSIHEPDVVAWTALIMGYVDNGESQAALDFFCRMNTPRGCAPDSVTYVAAIKAWTNLAADGDESRKEECLKEGREIHLQVGNHMDHFVLSALINMYAKCSSMVDARRLFDSIQKPNVMAWTTLILGYADNGEGEDALKLFFMMKTGRGCTPNSMTYVAAIKACTFLAAHGDGNRKAECLVRGREIHLEIGHHMNHFVHNTLIDMYCKCGSMREARGLFDSIENPDVVSWNALILGYADNGQGHAALDLFSTMQAAGECAPNSVTYVGALKACGSTGALAIGRKLHSQISDFTVHLVTCLVDVYAKCGSMLEACDVFDLHSTARVVPTWNALLAGYGSFGDTASVFNLFEAMQDQGFQPDAVTFVSMLSCCSRAGLVEKAREYLEAMIIQYGITPTVTHYNCMVDVLGRANQLDEAVAILQKMPCKSDVVTWTALLSACHKWGNVEMGKCAFQSLVDMDKKNEPAYVLLMAQIYGSKGMLKDQERLLETRIKLGTPKMFGEAYVYDEEGNLINFVVGEEDHSEVKDKLEEFFLEMKKCGYTFSCSHNVTDFECGHSERRAVAYGILRTAPGEPVRAFKNMRMCNDCHGLTKMISKFSGRVIMVRDASAFHVMMNGDCSCGDYW